MFSQLVTGYTIDLPGCISLDGQWAPGNGFSLLRSGKYFHRNPEPLGTGPGVNNPTGFGHTCHYPIYLNSYLRNDIKLTHLPWRAGTSGPEGRAAQSGQAKKDRDEPRHLQLVDLVKQRYGDKKETGVAKRHQNQLWPHHDFTHILP